jgi:nitrogen regulatory protein PII 2
MIKLIVMDDLVKKVVTTIIKTNKTGKSGDGKIFVLPVSEAYRVRTGESGDEILDEI